MSREPYNHGPAFAGHGAFEQRIGRALKAILAERRQEPEVVESRLGLPRGAVARLVRGDGAVDLATLQRVLLALGADPGDFLAGLYDGEAAEPAGDAPEVDSRPPAALEREAVEELLERITVTVRGLVRVLDARAAADELAER